MENLKHKNKVVGVKQTKAAIREGAAKKVYFAQDADSQITEPLKELCELSGIECLGVPGRKELAKACGVDVPTAAAAVLKAQTD